MKNVGDNPMKKLLISGTVVFLCATGWTYETSMGVSQVPSGLEAGQMQFHVQHHFYGPVSEDPWESFLGMQSGANVALQLNGAASRTLLWKIQYVFDHREYQFGIGYHPGLNTDLLSVQAGAEWATFKDPGDGRENSIFIFTAVQYQLLLKRITPVINLGYDFHTETPGMGLGMDIRLFRKMNLMAEYYPVLRDQEIETQSSVLIGLTLRTYGHHFMIFLTNNQEISTRRWILGAHSGEMALGFKIIRILDY